MSDDGFVAQTFLIQADMNIDRFNGEARQCPDFGMIRYAYLHAIVYHIYKIVIPTLFFYIKYPPNSYE